MLMVRSFPYTQNMRRKQFSRFCQSGLVCDDGSEESMRFGVVDGVARSSSEKCCMSKRG